MPIRRLLGLCQLMAMGLLFLASPSAQAQTCHVNGAFSMNFGTVTAAGRATTSNLKYTCAPDYAGGRTLYYQICLYLGPGDWSAGQATRRMTNYNGGFLKYDLFSDPAHTQLIGAPGSIPVYQTQLAVTPGSPVSTHAPIYGWVYPGQAVSASRNFQEQGIQGTLRYRYSNTDYPVSADCTSGGSGGGSLAFHSSGVLATYDNACWIVATDINFGATPPPQQAIHEHGSIRVQCAPGTPWKVGLNNGQHFDGAMRRMAGPAGTVRYQLYLDEAHTRVWGDDDETDRAAGTTDVAGNTVAITVYGEVPAQPDLAVGSYSDTIVATLYY